MKTYSLTRRLVLAVVLVELCSTFFLLAGAGFYESVSQFRAFQAELRGRADSLIGAVQDAGDEQDNVMLDGTQLRSPQQGIYAVWTDGDRDLGHSPNWPNPDAALKNSSEYQDLLLGGKRFRVIRVEGLRTVDPGENGGVPRRITVLYGAPIYPVWERIAKAMIFYALLSLLVLAASALITNYLLRRGLQPLHELTAQAAQISARHWDFSPSFRVQEVRELGPLVSALQVVLSGLEQSFDQQRRFIGDAAHELKTAVSIVKSSLQLLLIRDRGALEYRSGIDRAQRDCKRMEELTVGMLTLAALEVDSAETPGAEAIDCSIVLSEVVEQFRTMAELSAVDLVLLVDSPAWVLVEREQLRLLCSNLLHNALQHSYSGSQVRAIARSAGEVVNIRIEDEGEGIEDDVLPHVFERFYRGDASRSRKTGGAGLGLAIAKSIVEKMGGHLTIESQRGAGTQSIVLLPRFLQ